MKYRRLILERNLGPDLGKTERGFHFGHPPPVELQYRQKAITPESVSSSREDRSAMTDQSSLLTAYCLLLTAYCLLLTAYRLLLTAYRLPLTAYPLLLTQPSPWTQE
jgi:hypothetical protein